MSQVINFGVLHLFCGIGGGALGFQQSRGEWRGIKARFHTIAGIDCDPESCEDFENLTGVRAIQMDLFSRDDYVAYHGKQPPAGWKEVTAQDLRRSVSEAPDMIFMSPPCKGFSSLLPQKAAKSEKYEALNRLVIRGLFLAVEAWKDNLPGLILLENVPRITVRGKDLLHTLKGLLVSYGYAINEGFHDCGELGGLAQRRRRYLSITRQPRKIPNFVYKPPLQRLKSIGEVIGPLPMPDDTEAGGPMHRLPRLQWKTWLRLALIPPGGDWRDLQKITDKEWYSNAYRVIPWETSSGPVLGSARVNSSNGVAAVADPRLNGVNGYGNKYRVIAWGQECCCVTGSRFGSGAPAIADVRINGNTKFSNKYQVIKYSDPCSCVTGIPDVQAGAISIADTRLGCHPRAGSYGVMDWDSPSKTVTGAADIHAGATAIADPRIPSDTERPDPPPVIIALDGSRHRPLTTYELAMLQGFPSHMPDGRPLQLAGKSDARWRERVGNAVPPPSAMVVGNVSLQALLLGKLGAWELNASDIWVVPRKISNKSEIMRPKNI